MPIPYLSIKHRDGEGRGGVSHLAHVAVGVAQRWVERDGLVEVCKGLAQLAVLVQHLAHTTTPHTPTPHTAYTHTTRPTPGDRRNRDP